MLWGLCLGIIAWVALSVVVALLFGGAVRIAEKDRERRTASFRPERHEQASSPIAV
jgi:hypothetical protein